MKKEHTRPRRRPPAPARGRGVIGTSALDKDTADKVHNTILGLGKTVVEVAHYIPDEVKVKFDTVLELA